MDNITLHSDQELSLRVFNDAYFYNERKNQAFVKALVAEEFIYTDKQLEVLIEDLNDED